jgi:hypothetical protein
MRKRRVPEEEHYRTSRLELERAIILCHPDLVRTILV